MTGSFTSGPPDYCIPAHGNDVLLYGLATNRDGK